MEYRCGRCRQDKAEEEFFLSQRKTGAWCKQCHREYYGKTGANPSRSCDFCGVVMVDPNPKARFCSRKCKNDAKTAREAAVRIAAKAGRVCSGCGLDISASRADAKWCSERCAQKRPTRKGIARRAMLKSKYGISQVEYDGLLAKQRGKCAICRSTGPAHSLGVWAVDHDHVTGQVRGLLCSKCNTGIGQLRDDPDILVAAARYIRRHRQMVLPM